jgi:hypothetical protein
VIRQLIWFPNVTVCIVTSAPRFIFQDILPEIDDISIPTNCIYRHASFESGVDQFDAVTVDIQTTLTNLADFHLNKLSKAMKEEEVWIKNWKPDFIVSDAAYVPIHVSAKLGIDCITCTNFTFDGLS